MGRKRRDALSLVQSLVIPVEEHLEKLAVSPDHSSRRHWKREVRAWLNKMEALLRHVGKKTAAEWQDRIERWRAALEK